MDFDFEATNNQFTQQTKAKGSKKLFYIVNFILLFSLLFLFGLNQIIITRIYKLLGIQQGIFRGIDDIIGVGNKGGGTKLSGNLAQDAVKLAISQGVPEIYGPELGISFDQQVPQSMNIMKQYDPTYGQKKIVLTGDNLKRYIDVGLKISCEYCCGAKSIVFQDGSAACGCAHSQAMRGLLAYLIQNHGAEYSNDELLRELARWKGMYYPKQMIQKLTSQLQGGNFTPDAAALILGLKLPNYGKGSQNAPLPSEIENLPGMVGGC